MARRQGAPAGGAVRREFVAIADDGRWVGTAVALVGKAGDADVEGAVIEESGGHVVGVYVAPALRGRGVQAILFVAATGWLRDRGLPRARLYVHADNARAQRADAKSGFRPTGKRHTGPIGPEIEMALGLTSGA